MIPVISMRRFAGAMVALCAVAALQGCGSSTPVGSRGIPQIDHVVIIFQENRTTDNLFHGFPGADIADTGLDSQGNTITLQPRPLADDYDIGHAHGAFTVSYDDGRMDGFDKVPAACDESGDTTCLPPNPAYAYVNPEDVAPYFELAQRYVFADRMFQTNQGPSFPAHQYIISATSQPDASSPLFASENPFDRATGVNNEAGCDAPDTSQVPLIDASGDEHHFVYPCFEHQTLMDLLDERMISWRYYTPSDRSIWNGPAAIAHLRNGPGWNNVIIPQTQVLSDIAAGNLAQVTWVMPSAQASDHARVNDGSGPSWVASIVNAIGNSSYWDDTAIVIAWDDWGGWYDHVPPSSIYNQYEYGFRVPMIVVSPYAKAGYVSHVTHDFASIVKFVEAVFDLPTLGYADLRSDDLSDCFDFAQTPMPFETVPSSLHAGDFLLQEHPPSSLPGDPDDE